MDFFNDLNALQIMHNTYVGILEKHNEQINKLIEGGKTEEYIYKILDQKKLDYEKQINLLENKINEVANRTLRFSVENIFKNYGLNRRVIAITFLVTSDAYKEYGENVVGTLVYSNEDLMKLIPSFNTTDANDGYIKLDDKVTILSAEKREQLKTKGFLASEIHSMG